LIAVPDADGDELESREEVVGGLVVSRGDAAIVLDPVEEVLDAIVGLYIDASKSRSGLCGWTWAG
jgi:hypothetical protein